MSNQPASVPRRKPWGRFAFLVAACLGLGWLDVEVWLALTARPLPPGSDLEAPTELSFDGNSADCPDTVFLPTLDRPIPDGKSAVWCATTSLAWREFEKYLKKPVNIRGVHDICRELRTAPDPKLEPQHFYVAAGHTSEGILKRVASELARKFPAAPPLPQPLPDSGTIAVAYLEVAIFYDYFFKHSEDPLIFTDGANKTTRVHAFGIRKEDVGLTNERMREQVLVLFRNNGEFALDLSHGTMPYQIILARMPRKGTFKETLADLARRSAAAEPKHLNHAAIMLVPSMHWKIAHRYSELEALWEGDPQNRSIELFHQMVHFKLDRKGAYVASMVTVTLPDNGHPAEPPNPDHYFFDRPFLIVMRKRGVEQPFFAMWVDNAALLQRH